ncbi:MAG: cell surface protein [Bacteroidetes bacterium HGW-Bacteroidetes-12]|nr:MAG: cell surface protein [Bacteroidetes bacterium HGW-Bacteroidetes-12]
MKKVCFLFVVFILFSCSKEEIGPQCKNCVGNPIIPNSDKKILIVNEGNFGFGNASLSVYNPTTKELTNSVFQQANNFPLGDVAQSATLINNTIYVVVNNSSKIEVINKTNFTSIATLTGLISPRYILQINNTKAYVSNLFSNQIQLINLSNNTIIGSISTPSNWTEEMLLFNDTAYICDVSNNQILLINTNSDAVITSVSTGEQPLSLVKDKNNKLWILCDGGINSSLPQLIKFNPQTRQTEQVFTFNSINESPSEIEIDSAGEHIYFINNHIYKMNINDAQLPATSWVSNNNHIFYGLKIDQTTNDIYVSDAKDFVQNSTVFRYSQNGQLLHQFNAGINSGAFLVVE